MAYSRVERKMLLFLAPSAPLWQAVFEWERYLAGSRIFLEQLLDPTLEVPKRRQGPAKAGPRDLHLATNHSYASEWAKGEGSFRTADRQTQTFRRAISATQKAIEAIRDAIERSNSADGRQVHTTEALQYPEQCNIWSERIGRFAATLDDKSHTVYTSGDLLGIGVSEAQKAIDAVINKGKPLLALAYYNTDQRHFEDDLASRGGVHYVGLRRGNRWLQATLQVRYALDFENGKVLRCKLMIPNLQGLTEPWEYDGFLREVRDNLYFAFEKRSKAGSGRKDFFFLIVAATLSPRTKKSVLSGTYLTSDQDERRSTVSGAAVMLRRSPFADGQGPVEREQAKLMNQAWDLASEKLSAVADVADLKSLL